MIGYTDTIRHWATIDRHVGLLADADGTGEIGLESGEIGRRLAVRFTLKVDAEKVTDVRFQVFGCGFTIAACAVAADLAVGYSLKKVGRIDSAQVDQALGGLPEERSYCAELAAEALTAAIVSVANGKAKVAASLDNREAVPIAADANDPLYRALMNSPAPGVIATADRHLFACLLTKAAKEAADFWLPLGLSGPCGVEILATFFPQAKIDDFLRKSSDATPPPETDPELRTLLLAHVPSTEFGLEYQVSSWLAHILAARAAHPGHLWVAMGLHQRPELTAAISRHLPSLAAANSQNMRWKRYLFRQLCDLKGGTMCKAPNCGVCSDYALCFAD